MRSMVEGAWCQTMSPLRQLLNSCHLPVLAKINAVSLF